jgi:flagellar hook protein FlgE
MGFQQGLSGLDAASKSLDAIGNNVANSSTVGFKSSTVEFADVFASSLTGAGGSQIGIGTQVANVAQQFTQGNVTSTSNPLDIAINGGGFFRMDTNGSITYSRNGQFQLDKNGYIVDSGGAHLTGYAVNAQGVLATGAPSDLQISSATLSPSATTSAKEVLNLDSRESVPTTTPFSASDSTSFNNSDSISVYDSLGNSHMLQTYYVKTGANSWNVYATNDGSPIGYTAGTPATNTGASVVASGAPTSFTAIPAGTFSINGVSIGAVAAGTNAITQGANVAAAINAANITNVTATANPATGVVTISNSAATPSTVISMNGSATSASAAATDQTTLLAQTGLGSTQMGTQSVYAPIGQLNFKGDGSIDTSTTTLPLTIPMSTTTGAYTPFSVTLDYTGSSQYGADFSVSSLTQNGYASGNLSGFSVGDDGTIIGNYSNGQSATLGQVVLANFTNPNGLQSLGKNQWGETANSGQPIIGAPGSGTLGALQSSAVEDSNVDLTSELVNMITAQRAYQANAQTIKTEDQVMQTLVNLPG